MHLKIDSLFIFQIGQPQVAEIMNPQPTEVNTNLQNNAPQLQHMSTANINTGNTELANTPSHIEQSVPNEMDTIDPNITQNISNITTDMKAEVDNEDDIDSDDEDDDIKDDEHNSDNEDNGMVHESVGDDMQNDNLVQNTLSHFDNVPAVPSSAFGQLVGDRNHHCEVRILLTSFNHSTR